MSFLVLGDWGGSSDSKPSTSAQIDDGKGMAKVGAALNASFVMAVGDNVSARRSNASPPRCR